MQSRISTGTLEMGKVRKASHTPRPMHLFHVIQPIVCPIRLHSHFPKQDPIPISNPLILLRRQSKVSISQGKTRLCGHGPSLWARQSMLHESDRHISEPRDGQLSQGKCKIQQPCDATQTTSLTQLSFDNITFLCNWVPLNAVLQSRGWVKIVWNRRSQGFKRCAVPGHVCRASNDQ